ncbi:hypothetical protein C8J57DRAFT_1531203 [Mycena rebaudengoi]|nr:hypothetical protein C8J57DRAFT_1531203 [Mycena rebaudengoi]
MQPAHDVTMRSSAISALAPAHDANLTIQPLSTGLSVTILRVIRIPHPRARLLLTHRLHQADSHVFGVRTDLRALPMTVKN